MCSLVDWDEIALVSHVGSRHGLLTPKRASCLNKWLLLARFRSQVNDDHVRLVHFVIVSVATFDTLVLLFSRLLYVMGESRTGDVVSDCSLRRSHDHRLVVDVKMRILATLITALTFSSSAEILLILHALLGFLLALIFSQNFSFLIQD